MEGRDRHGTGRRIERREDTKAVEKERKEGEGRQKVMQQRTGKHMHMHESKGERRKNHGFCRYMAKMSCKWQWTLLLQENAKRRDTEKEK